jgi:uncharacterized protein (TIGR00661 family)
MIEKKTLLVAPLNWGLGHATRCIPIIRALKEDGYKVIIASDGAALELLCKEFPDEKTVKLPGYNISYSKKGSDFTRKMLASCPRVYKAVRAEHKLLDALIDSHNIDGVISDNRLGLYTSKVPTVFITHQLTVLSGKNTWLSSLLHKKFIKRYDHCWVPDYKGDNNLSGKLGHPKNAIIPTTYLGPLSRLKPTTVSPRYKAIAVLSGPEPQRTLLEEILLRELKKYPGKVLLVQGIVAGEQSITKTSNIKIVNYLTSSELEKAINASEFVISRSGYTSIMDLACLGKKAFFIPTPGQPEQEYLAERLKNKGVIPFSKQDDFKIKDLAKIKVYNGFEKEYQNNNLRQFISLFEGERKLRTHSKFTFDIDFLLVRFYNMFDNRKTKA